MYLKINRNGIKLANNCIGGVHKISMSYDPKRIQKRVTGMIYTYSY